MAYKVKLNGKTYENLFGRNWYDASGNAVTNPKTLQSLQYARENGLNTLKTSFERDKWVGEKKWGKNLGIKPEKFYSKKGILADWAKPLGITKDSYQKGKLVKGESMWRERPFFDTEQNRVRYTDKRTKWGAQTAMSKKGVDDYSTFNPQQFIRHLDIAIHMLYVNQEHFRTAMGHYSLKIFKKSFAMQKFNSDGASPWKPLSSFTKNKREKRGTWRGRPILRELLDLQKSLVLGKTPHKKGRKRGNTTAIYTDFVKGSARRKFKKQTLCYAGWHNEGEGTYGRAGKGGMRTHYVQRQFMGHSSHFDPLRDKMTRKLVTLYFFDDVFLARKRV